MLHYSAPEDYLHVSPMMTINLDKVIVLSRSSPRLLDTIEMTPRAAAHRTCRNSAQNRIPAVAVGRTVGGYDKASIVFSG